MALSKKHFHSIALETALSPQEEMLHVGKNMQRLTIGIPKETSFQERRVALAPESVGLLVSRGHDVIIESGAGNESNFLDHDYSECGANHCLRSQASLSSQCNHESGATEFGRNRIDAR